jgi:hypothetical protein
MINYKFRSCYKKWTYISLSAAQRPIGVLSTAHWPIGMCSLLGRRACYCAVVHATVQGPAVHHVTSLGTQKYIFKVQGSMWHTLVSSGACGAFNSWNKIIMCCTLHKKTVLHTLWLVQIADHWTDHILKLKKLKRKEETWVCTCD